MDIVMGGGALLGLLIFAVQIALLLYVLTLLRRTAEGVEHIGVVLERGLARAFPSERNEPETEVEWVGRPIEVDGARIAPGSRGRVVDHGDELVVAFLGVTFTCTEEDIRPLR